MPIPSLVLALVERGGNVRVKVIDRATQKNLHRAALDNISPHAIIMTDEWPSYRGLKYSFKGHGVIKHKEKVYAKGDIYTNTAESFFALLKRGIMGQFHHVSKKHLPRYCSEFSFRWNHRFAEDIERTKIALRQAEGKRLYYKLPN